MIDVLKYQRLTAFLSFFIFAGSIGLYFYKRHVYGHAFTYSVDFEGGTQVLLKFDKPMGSAQLRSILEKEGWHGAVTREFASDELLVRVKEFSSDAKGLAQRMSESLSKATGAKITVLESGSVGASVSSTLRHKSLMAFLLVLIAMLGYIWFRFWSVAFAVGAVVSLIHDAVVIVAAFLLLDREVSSNLIFAVLTMLGYSINDTIIIFARIREHLRTMPGRPIEEIVTLSINQTLRRTILTSFATSLTVLAMLLLGGEALRDLSIALMIGIVFGTYSSIYIASPVMILLYRGTKEHAPAH